MGLAERWLTWRLKRRDESAARELISRYHAGIYAYLRHRGADAETAEDLTQETYAKAWQRIDTLSRPDSLRSWLYTIARNEHLQMARARADVPEDVDPPETGIDPLDALATNEESLRLRNEVIRLENGLREVVTLHYFRGLSLRESADVLGISPGTAKSRLHRALEHLRTALPKEDNHVAPGSRTTA